MHAPEVNPAQWQQQSHSSELDDDLVVSESSDPDFNDATRATHREELPARKKRIQNISKHDAHVDIDGYFLCGKCGKQVCKSTDKYDNITRNFKLLKHSSCFGENETPFLKPK